MQYAYPYIIFAYIKLLFYYVHLPYTHIYWAFCQVPLNFITECNSFVASTIWALDPPEALYFLVVAFPFVIHFLL